MTNPPASPTRSEMMLRKNSITQTGDHARRHQFLGGIHAHGAHGIDLLGHFHGTQFAGHAAGVSARHHHSRQYRTQFADHRQRNQLAGERQRTKLLQRAGSLQGQHRASEEAGEDDNRQGADTDRIGLQQSVGVVARPGEKVASDRPARSEYSCTASTFSFAMSVR